MSYSPEVFIQQCEVLISASLGQVDQQQIEQTLTDFPNHGEFPFYTFLLYNGKIQLSEQNQEYTNSTIRSCLKKVFDSSLFYHYNKFLINNPEIKNATLDEAVQSFLTGTESLSEILDFIFDIDKNYALQSFSTVINQLDIIRLVMINVAIGHHTGTEVPENYINIFNTTSQLLQTEQIDKQSAIPALILVFNHIEQFCYQFLKFNKIELVNAFTNMAIFIIESYTDENLLQIDETNELLIEILVFFARANGEIQSKDQIDIIQEKKKCLEKAFPQLFDALINLLHLISSNIKSVETYSNTIYLLGLFMDYMEDKHVNAIVKFLLQGSAIGEINESDDPQTTFNILFDCHMEKDLYERNSSIRTACAEFVIRYFIHKDDLNIIDMIYEHGLSEELLYLVASLFQYLIDNNQSINEQECSNYFEKYFKPTIEILRESELSLTSVYFLSICPYFGIEEVLDLPTDMEFSDTFNDLSYLTLVFRMYRNSISLGHQYFLQAELLSKIIELSEKILNNEVNELFSVFINAYNGDDISLQDLFNLACKNVKEQFAQLNEKIMDDDYEDILNQTSKNINLILSKFAQYIEEPSEMFAAYKSLTVTIMNTHDLRFELSNFLTIMSPFALQPFAFPYYIDLVMFLLDILSLSSYVYDFVSPIYSLLDNHPEVLTATIDGNFVILMFFEKALPLIFNSENIRSHLEDVDAECIVLIFLKVLFSGYDFGQEVIPNYIQAIRSTASNISLRCHIELALIIISNDLSYINNEILGLILNCLNEDVYQGDYLRALISTALIKLYNANPGFIAQEIIASIRENPTMADYEYPDYKLIPGFSEDGFVPYDDE